MNLTAEQIQIASLIDVRVQELAAAGTDDITIFAEMYDYMPGFKRLMDTSTRGEMDALCDRFANFYRYAKILERVAVGSNRARSGYRCNPYWPAMFSCCRC